MRSFVYLECSVTRQPSPPALIYMSSGLWIDLGLSFIVPCSPREAARDFPMPLRIIKYCDLSTNAFDHIGSMLEPPRITVIPYRQVSWS